MRPFTFALGAVALAAIPALAARTRQDRLVCGSADMEPRPVDPGDVARMPRPAGDGLRTGTSHRLSKEPSWPLTKPARFADSGPSCGGRTSGTRWWPLCWRASSAAFSSGVALRVAMEAANAFEFCTGCHSIADTSFKEDKETVHHANRSGVRAVCSDCHVPRDWVHKVAAENRCQPGHLPRAHGQGEHPPRSRSTAQQPPKDYKDPDQ
jgi:hypothetical protein